MKMNKTKVLDCRKYLKLKKITDKMTNSKKKNKNQSKTLMQVSYRRKVNKHVNELGYDLKT